MIKRVIINVIEKAGPYILACKGFGWSLGVNFLGDMNYGIVGDIFHKLLEYSTLSSGTITDIANGCFGQEIGRGGGIA